MSGTPAWNVRSPADARVDRLAEALGCSRVLAAVLVNRGITDPELASRFLDPSLADLHAPDSLPDITAAVGRLGAAIDRGETITVYADRDLDGVAGAVILLELLESFDANVGYHVPGKWDGYGLSVEAVDALADRGTEVLLTVDCGTTAVAEVERARSRGLDVVVTDHHSPETATPDVDALVNPCLAGSEYPHAALAGGGVAFKVGHALLAARSPDAIEAYRQYGLPLAALATLGDYVDLNLENRAIAREGFDRLFDSGLPGLVRAAEHAGVESIRDIAWSLNPLLNAAQEDDSGDFMLKLFLARDPDRIAGLIATLEEYREQRRAEWATQETHLSTCLERQADPEEDLLFLVETDTYVGGVPMNRVSERWGKPVIAYRRKGGIYTGGGRSDPDVDFLELYESCRDLVERTWGHPGAAGFEVPKAAIGEFTQRLSEAVSARYDPDELRPKIDIDTTLSPGEITPALSDEIDRLRPFGNGNEEPVFVLRGVELTAVSTFGDDDHHCRVTVADADFEGIYWDGADRLAGRGLPLRCDLVGGIQWDEFTDGPTLVLEDLRPEGEDGS